MVSEKIYSEEIINDSLKVLARAIRAINTKHLLDLELISNEVIHNATIEQDVISTTISKILYSIFKIERHSLIKNIPLPAHDLVKDLIVMHDKIGSGKITEFKIESEKLISKIENLATQIHVDNIFDRSGVKKGGKIYDHGISIAQAADAMHVSPWELYPYVGRTKLNDYPQDIDKRVKLRLSYTRGLFL